MFTQSQALKFDEALLHRMHDRQNEAGIDSGMLNFHTYKSRVIDDLRPYCEMIFNILSKCPAAADLFIETCNDEEYHLLYGLNNLINATPEPHIDEITGQPIIPGLAYHFEDGSLMMQNFDGNIYPDILAKRAAGMFYDSFTLEDMQNLTEDEQVLLLEILSWDNTPIAEDKAQHKKLVFGLHLPQEIKDYHEERAKELQRRILTSPVYASILASLISDNSKKNPGIKRYKKTHDKRMVVNFFMNELADIWGTPRPLEEDYRTPPTIDKDGRRFESAMHAFHRFEPKEITKDFDETVLDLASGEEVKRTRPVHTVQKLGYIFGINTHRGYLQDPSLETFNTLAHEFAHIFSRYVSHSYDEENTPISAMRNFYHLMQAGHMQYYEPTEHSFEGFTAPPGQSHPYKGQLEERHADFLGDLIEEAVDEAHQTRKFVWNIDLYKDYLQKRIETILKNADLKDFEKNAFNGTYHDLRNAESFQAIFQTLADFQKQMQTRAQSQPDLKRQMIHDLSCKTPLKISIPQWVEMQCGQLLLAAEVIERLSHLIATPASKTAPKNEMIESFGTPVENFFE